MNKLSRRDILKLGMVTAGGAALSLALPRTLTAMQSADRPNILVLVFDTMSAPHLSVNGYQRSTTPNFEAFAQNATVFHSHYSNGSFTTPGTASILTGLAPWSHRAIGPGGLVRRDLLTNNLFHAVGSAYHRIGFTQNLWAEMLLRQFHADIDLHLPTTSFAYPNPMLLGELDHEDPISYIAYDDFLVGGVKLDTPYPGSVLLGLLDIATSRGRNLDRSLRSGESGAVFNNYYYYQHREVFQGILESVRTARTAQNRPYLGYFHLWSPHEPYLPADEYKKLFDDQMDFPRKPEHAFAPSPINNRKLFHYRRIYDQYIANVDAEFGRFMHSMEQNGLLENTYVVILSDHGQLFERGVHGHASRLLYDGVIHVPMMIAAPGQTRRVDVYEPTSNLDLLPTLVHLAGGQMPERHEGRILPELGGESQPARPIFSMLASETPAYQPLKRGTFVLRKGSRKLMLLSGYQGYEDASEMYDVENDPDELQDLSQEDPESKKIMLEELLDARQDADAKLPKGV